MCCSVLQRFTACCSVLQHVAVCCSVLQSVEELKEVHPQSELYLCVYVCVMFFYCFTPPNDETLFLKIIILLLEFSLLYSSTLFYYFTPFII